MERIQTVSASQISEIIVENPGLLFVHFGSPLASSCEVVHDELEELAPDFGGEIAFAEVELPLQDVELIQKFSIESIPTLILFEGKREIERLEHLLQKEELEEFLRMAASFYGSSDSGGARGGDHL